MALWRRKPKVSLTGVSFPVIGGGLTWESEADERKVRARTERADAFVEVWSIVQTAHIGLRNNFDNVDQLTDVHRQLNVILIQRAPVLAPSDIELAQQFLVALGEFIRTLRPRTGKSAQRLREEIATTAANPRFPADLHDLEEIYLRVVENNNALMKRYREVVFGES